MFQGWLWDFMAASFQMFHCLLWDCMAAYFQIASRLTVGFYWWQIQLFYGCLWDFKGAFFKMFHGWLWDFKRTNFKCFTTCSDICYWCLNIILKCFIWLTLRFYGCLFGMFHNRCCTFMDAYFEILCFTADS